MSKSKESFAKEYAMKILNASNKVEAANEVIKRIDEIVYSETNKNLKNSDKKRIIDETIKIINEARFKPDSKGRRIILNEKENLSYIELLKAVSDKLGEEKGK